MQKLKRVLNIFIMLTMVTVAMSIVTFANNTIVEYKVADGYIGFDTATGTVAWCGYGVTEAKIPERINEVEVTSIGDKAFYWCDDLTSIIIPNSVTSIGNEAFYDCDNLTSIMIPDGVTSIGKDAFYGTPWLTAKRAENPLVIVNNILIDGIT